MSTRRERRKPSGAAQGPPDVNDGSLKVNLGSTSEIRSHEKMSPTIRLNDPKSDCNLLSSVIVVLEKHLLWIVLLREATKNLKIHSTRRSESILK